MKTNIGLFALFLCLQACLSNPPIPLCEPNESTQEEFSTASNNTGIRDPKLRVFTDYDAGLACAQRQNKPVFLAFTGYTIRVRYFSDIVLQNPIIVNYLMDNFVPIFLYVDDRKKLPDDDVEEIVEEDGRIIRIRTHGNRNAYLQKTVFQRQSQPYLVWMTWEEELLTSPLGYRSDVNDYVEAFHAAIKAFENIE